MTMWWRAYSEAVDDPKLQCLPDETFRFWFNLCCVCSAYGGNLPPTKFLAFKLRMQERKIIRLLGELTASGLIDKDEQGLRPHNWHGRQYKSDVSTERVKRFRQQKGNVSSAVSETPPEYRVQNTEKERKKDAPNGALAENVTADPERELFSRGREVLGKNSGGLVKQLLTAKEGKVPLARATIEVASTKYDPREYIGAILSKQELQPGYHDMHVDGRL